MISKDKESEIVRALESTKGVFDGYFLQDTGSSDKTKEAFESWCRKNNKVFKTSKKFVGKDYKSIEIDGKKVLGDFASARNDSFALAKNFKPDFYFWMDSDDVIVNPEVIRNIADVLYQEGNAIALLKYMYARDPWGNPFLPQYRERLLPARVGGSWVGRVHETYNFSESVKPMGFETCYLDHLRTVKESIDTGRRNHLILESVLKEDGINGMTDKMLNDMAFDHWEHKEYKDAIRFYKEIIKRKLGQPMDGMMYEIYIKIGKAYMGLGLPERALKYAFMAQQCNKEIADAYLLLAEIYVSLSDWKQAEFYANEVLRIGRPATASPIIEYDYNVVPLQIKLQCRINQNDIPGGINILQEIYKYYPDDGVINEKRNLEDELRNIETIKAINTLGNYYQSKNKHGELQSVIDAIPLALKDHPIIRNMIDEYYMDIKHKTRAPYAKNGRSIIIYAGQGYENWDGNSDIEKGIGGSEGMTIQISRALAKLGNKVFIYNSCGESDGKEFDGVTYIDHKKFDANAKCDIFISLRNFGVLNRIIRANKVYLWLHDTHYGDVPMNIVYSPDRIFALSDSHKQILKQKHGIVDDSIFWMTRNALNQYAVDYANKNAGPRDNHKFIYASSYDRGLDNLLSMWGDIKASDPLATLDIYYGWNTYDAIMAGRAGTKEGEYMSNYKSGIIDKISKLDGVRELGRISQKELYKKFKEAGFWIYPTKFYEISCITAMCAQAMGAIPICTPFAALKETVNGKLGYKISIDDGPFKFTDITKRLLKQTDSLDDRRKQLADWAYKAYNIDDLASSWNNFFSTEK